MITLRVDAMWDYNKTITYTMLGGFAVTYTLVLAFFIVGMIDLYSAHNLVAPTPHRLTVV